VTYTIIQKYNIEVNKKKKMRSTIFPFAQQNNTIPTSQNHFPHQNLQNSPLKFKNPHFAPLSAIL